MNDPHSAQDGRRRFLRLALAACCAAVAGYWAGAASSPPRVASSNVQQLPAAPPDMQPSSELTPAEVVKIQLAGLREERGDLVGMAKCFAFASPLNRAATGPLERFATMVTAEPYRKLLAPEQILVGKTIIRGDRALVLASLVDGKREFASFQFVLTRQSDPPYADCWMTDAVLQVAAARSEPAPRPNPPPGPNPAI